MLLQSNDSTVIFARYSTPLRLAPNSDHPVLEYAVWVPGGADRGGGGGGGGSALLIAHENNLYYRPRAADPETFSITTDGLPDLLYHGVSDPLYRGEAAVTEITTATQ